MSKEQEAEAVGEFVRLLPLQGATFDPREGPDFELTLSDGRKVGLEVTELHVQNQAKRQAVCEHPCDEVFIVSSKHRA